MDLRAAIAENETLTLKAGQRKLVPTGFILEIPEGL
jgi:dUTP pyrophosphatase